MNNKIKIYEIVGIIFVIIVGSLLHFTYYWSGNNTIVALFSAVNESTWEHLKLLFFPFIFYSIFEYFIIGHKYSNFITAKVLGIIAGLISIPIIFYTYTVILGDNYLILDILTFIIGVIVSYIFSWYVLKNESISYNNGSIVILVFLIMLFLFLPLNHLLQSYLWIPLLGLMEFLDACKELCYFSELVFLLYTSIKNNSIKRELEFPYFYPQSIKFTGFVVNNFQSTVSL